MENTQEIIQTLSSQKKEAYTLATESFNNGDSKKAESFYKLADKIQSALDEAVKIDNSDSKSTKTNWDMLEMPILKEG